MLLSRFNRNRSLAFALWAVPVAWAGGRVVLIPPALRYDNMVWMQRWFKQLDRRVQGIVTPVALHEQQAETKFNWRLSIYGAVGASIVLLSLFVYGSDASLLHIFVVAPIFCLCCIILLVRSAIHKEPRRCLSILFAIVAFLAVSVALFSEQGTLRPTLRWLLWSHRYKAELMAAPNAANGALKHIEWDVSGWGPVGPTFVYLVFDRTDSLSVAAKNHQPGRYSGIPCEVARIQRLESHLYAVTFYTGESWGERNRLDCSGFGG